MRPLYPRIPSVCLLHNMHKTHKEVVLNSVTVLFFSTLCWGSPGSPTRPPTNHWHVHGRAEKTPWNKNPVMHRINQDLTHKQKTQRPRKNPSTWGPQRPSPSSSPSSAFLHCCWTSLTACADAAGQHPGRTGCRDDEMDAAAACSHSGVSAASRSRAS